MNNYQNIPTELQILKQWILWKYEDIGAAKPTKIPYTITGKMASVNNPTDWSTFEEVLAVVADYSGIGFVFTDLDEYTFIDLDQTSEPLSMDRQIKIFKELDSYSEISPSGNGLHIIIKGKILAGRRRSFIEIYSSQRYATFTGNIYPPNEHKPIAERQSMLTQLWEQMGSGPTATILYNGEDKEVLNDTEVLAQAQAATNGDKFKDLYEGNWQLHYQSQSEADFAFIDIIAFYSKNRTQIARIFRASILGQRDKAKRNDYVSWMVNKSFDKMLPQLDFDGFKNAVELQIEESKEMARNAKPMAGRPAKPVPPPYTHNPETNPVIIPPGLLGEIAQFIYHTAPRPVPEIALAGAIGLMAGVCGRAYNVSNTGLNQYVLLLAKTGMGKEGMRVGIDKLTTAVKLQVPAFDSFIGPGHISSGQALVKYIHNKSQCFVSILGEFGITIQNISDVRANPHERRLKQDLLDLYVKSGHNDIYRASIHADMEKNSDILNSPAISILGESVPHLFYAALNEEMVIGGLLPRFLLIEYNGIRVNLNKEHDLVKPSFQLVEKFASLAANCLTLMHSKKVINIQFTPEALAMADEFDRYATMLINSTQDEVALNLWNRAHLKAIKLAGLIAVGCNMIYPTIEAEHLKLAMGMVKSDIKTLSTRFESGDVGVSNSETKQIAELIRIIKDYTIKDFENFKRYSVPKALHHAKVIPYMYISKRLISMASFRTDRVGATNAIKRAITTLLESDNLRELSKKDLAEKFGTTQRAFIISNTSIVS